MMSFNKILGTLQKDKVGQIIGVVAAEYKKAQSLGQDFFGLVNLQIKALFTDPHFPDINTVISELTTETSGAGKVFMPSVKLAIISWILKELNLHPQLTRYAKIGTKVGTNVAIGATALSLWAHATHQHSPGAPNSGSRGSSGNSETWRYAN